MCTGGGEWRPALRGNIATGRCVLELGDGGDGLLLRAGRAVAGRPEPAEWYDTPLHGLKLAETHSGHVREFAIRREDDGRITVRFHYRHFGARLAAWTRAGSAYVQAPCSKVLVFCEPDSLLWMIADTIAADGCPVLGMHTTPLTYKGSVGVLVWEGIQSIGFDVHVPDGTSHADIARDLVRAGYLPGALPDDVSVFTGLGFMRDEQ